MIRVFEHFWSSYPKKVEKQDAMLQWRLGFGGRMLSDKEFTDRVGTAFVKWLTFWREEGTELHWIPSFGRWIKRGQYEVDPRGVIK